MLTVEAIPYNKCLKYDPIDPHEHLVKLTNNNFCIINRVGIGPCNGDSGSAVVWNGAQIGNITFGVRISSHFQLNRV